MQTLILKALNACNLRCAYCSLGDKGQTAALTVEQTADALLFFAAQAQAAGENQVQIIFHGGEPMLLPAEQYGHGIRAVLEAYPGLKYRFSIQTNGTLLTPEYLELFQRYHIHVGVSLDGGVHDSQRRDRSGNATYTRIMENIRTLLANGIPVSTLMVVTKPAMQSGLEFLRELDGLGLAVKINPLLPLGEAAAHPELALMPGDYGRYLARVFAFVAAEKLTLHVSPLAELLHAVLYQQTPRGCQYNPQCVRNFMCIDPSGTLYPCGRFADAHNSPLGTIAGGFRPERREMIEQLEARRTTGMPEECRSCSCRSYCNAGCSADGREPGAVSTACEDVKEIIRYLRTEGLEIIEKQLLAERDRLEKLIAEKEGADGV